MNTTRPSHILPGILLTNLGTPAAPTARALRPYLRQFLSDRRVIDYPRWLWYPILYGIILNTRPRRSARLYQNIWTDSDSPLLTATANIAEGLTGALLARYGLNIPVEIGMRYGEPSIASGLRKLRQRGVRKVLIFPLYPQYSATTTGTSFDAIFEELRTWRRQPALRTVASYHNHPLYIAALASSIRANWEQAGRVARTLFSFHGIPQRYAQKGDPYPEQCRETASLTAAALELAPQDWSLGFQSRFGPEAWVQPYTDEVLSEWGAAGLESASVICPGFAADCLETLDEIGREGRKIFREAGGGTYRYIPALNDRRDHIAALTEIACSNLAGWLEEHDQ